MNKNVIYINARFLTQETTGVQRFASELSKKIKNSNLEAIFLAPKVGIIQHRLLQELKVIQIGNFKGYIWEQIELPLFLKTIGSPILVNLMSTSPILYFNKIYTLHDITFIRYPKNFNWKFRIVYKILVPLMLRSSKKIITVSNFSKNEIISYYGIENKKISIVYNGINVEINNELRINENSSNHKYFLTVSTPSENKNLIRLIEAFVLLDRSDIKLYIIGGFDSFRYKNISGINNYSKNMNIVFKGRVSDEELKVYYKNAIGFLFPSLYEGFGIPPLEAQNYGCPVMVSAINVFSEIYRDSVIYCDPFSVKDITKNLSLLVKDKKLVKELKMKGLENVKKFTWDKSFMSFQNIILNYHEEN